MELLERWLQPAATQKIPGALASLAQST